MPIQNATPRRDILLTILEEQPDLANAFIAHRLFPVWRTMVSTGPIPKVLARRTIERLIRGRYGSFPRGQLKTEDGGTFNCQEQGFEEPWDAKDEEILGGPEGARAAVGGAALQLLLLATEKILADVLFTTATFGSGFNTAGAAAWDNASGKPLDDVALAGDEVFKRTGRQANTLVIGAGALLALRRNPQIQTDVRAVLGNTDRAGIQHKITDNLLAEIFGLEQVLIGAATYNTADEGQAEALSRIWADDKALVCYVPPENSMISVGLGRTFVWDEGLDGTGDDGASELSTAGVPGMILEEYPEQGKNVGVMRARNFQDPLLMNKGAGHLITGL